MATCVVCQLQATVYCENDKAFLCKECDNKIHSSNLVASRHARVRVCELCSRTASTVFCKNDKAFLCDGCDAEIHLNNPLAARHHIVPVGKLAEEGGCANVEAANAPCESFAQSEAKPSNEVDAPEQASKPASPTSSEAVVPQMFNADTDLPSKEAVLKTTWGKDFDFLELDNGWLDMGFDFTDILSDGPSDAGLVPTFSGRDEDCTDDNAVPTLTSGQLSESAAEVPSAKRAASDSLEAYAPATKMPYTSTSSSFPAHPTSYVGAPMPHMYPGAMPQLPLSQGPLPLPGMMANSFHLPQSTLLIGSQAALNREQRVMRYREKRKNRKFEKTIRYASRKAYAEVRPRIKGRFAKKDELLSGAWADEDGVVPDMLA